MSSCHRSFYSRFRHEVMGNAGFLTRSKGFEKKMRSTQVGRCGLECSQCFGPMSVLLVPMLLRYYHVARVLCSNIPCGNYSRRFALHPDSRTDFGLVMLNYSWILWRGRFEDHGTSFVQLWWYSHFLTRTALSTHCFCSTVILLVSTTSVDLTHFLVLVV